MGFFVAAHVAAVALLYGVALAIGGGLSAPPFPPDVHLATRTPAPATHRASATGAAGAATTLAAGTALGTTSSAALPAWAQRHEAIAPWEGR